VIGEATIGYHQLDKLRIYGAIWDAPCLINLSHVKGHGDCGYGGACKNIAMGCVDAADPRQRSTPSKAGSTGTRPSLHVLRPVRQGLRHRGGYPGQGRKDRLHLSSTTAAIAGIAWPPARPRRMTMRDERGFSYFQEGMALTTKAVLDSFDPTRVLHLNVLTQITMFCDCWGMTTPSLVPDIGIMGSHDMVALESACLDAIKSENLIPGTLIGKWAVARGRAPVREDPREESLDPGQALETHGIGMMKHTVDEVV
jgi:uncharacterized protein